MSPDLKSKIEALAVFDENTAHNGYAMGLLRCAERVYPGDLRVGDVLQNDRFPTRIVCVTVVEPVPPDVKGEPDGIRIRFNEPFALNVGEEVVLYPKMNVSKFPAGSKFYQQPRLEWDNYFMRVPKELCE